MNKLSDSKNLELQDNNNEGNCLEDNIKEIKSFQQNINLNKRNNFKTIEFELVVEKINKFEEFVNNLK